MKDIKTIQKNQLVILKEIKRICEKYEITYYLSSGTLLGAVRHGGFIPWDDDIDIEMPLTDYKRFLKVCKKELKEEFFLQTYETDENYQDAFAKIRMNNTTFLPVHHRKHKIHHGFWVDIFPIVRVPKNEKIFAIKKKIIQISNYVQAGNYVLANYEEFKGLLGTKLLNIVLFFNKLPISFRKNVHSIMLSFIMKSPKENCPISYVWTTYDRLPMNICFEEMIDIKFEDDYFKAPKRYDDYLTFLYGDYMKLPPEDQRQGHGTFIVDENNNYTKYLEIER